MKHVLPIRIQPADFFIRLSEQEKHVCFLTTSIRGGWRPTLAWNPSALFSYRRGSGKAAMTRTARNFVKTQGEKGRKIIGYFSYDLGYELHNIAETAEDDLQLPDVYLFAYDNWAEFTKEAVRVYYREKDFLEKVNELLLDERNGTKPFVSGSVPLRVSTTASEYRNAFQRVKQYIKNGHTYQINIAHRMQGRTRASAPALFCDLLKRNAVGFAAYMEGNGFEILSASPERFIKVKGRAIETCPIKGTRPRGKTREEDERFKKELLNNKKEQAELDMITDLLRNDIGKVCLFGSVKVRGRRLVSPCETVWHTYSRIAGQLKKGIHPIEALLSMLPGGSVTGCPKKRALEIIDEIEPCTRSVYCGAIGCIEPNGDADFNIAIRTVIKKGEAVYLSVGGGVVYDSDCEAEFAETLEKARSFL